MFHNIWILFLFVLTTFVLPVSSMPVEYPSIYSEMTWEDREEAMKLLNRIDFIRLDLYAIKGAALSNAKRIAQNDQPDSDEKKVIKKIKYSALKNASKLHDLFEHDLSFFPQEIQFSIKEQERHLQELYYDFCTIQSVQDALDRVENFHKAIENLVEISLFHFLKEKYPKMF